MTNVITVNDLINLITTENNNNIISVYCPSINNYVKLSPLLIGIHKSILVSYYNAIELNNMSLFDNDLSNFLNKLIVNKHEINLHELNPIDKINLLLNLKKNSENKTKLTLTCINDECKARYNIDKIIVNDNSLEEHSFINYKVLLYNKEFMFTLKVPSILKTLEYDNYLNQRLASITDQYEKDLLLEYSENFEQYITYVTAISIDGNDVIGYKDLSIVDKINLFDKFGSTIFDIDLINNLTINSSKHLIYNVKCPNCETVNKNMIEPKDFMI